MPSQNPTISNIAITNKNENQPDALIDARILCNYGDPGLTENYNFDILSRYLICMIESSNRALTTNRIGDMLIVVERPQALWISYSNGVASSTPTQQREDDSLNVNIGDSSNYSTAVIPAINIPYNLGDVIKIQRKPTPHSLLMGDTFFQSADNRWKITQQNYGSWANQGATIPYISNQVGGAAALQQKTITPYGSNPLNLNANQQFFYLCINKAQYEAFVLNQFPDQTTDLVQLFTNQSNFNAFYDINGGYYFSENTSYNFCSVMYEDVNINLRSRTSVNSCIPAVIVSPNAFSPPSVRSVGVLSYSPTYISQDPLNTNPSFKLWDSEWKRAVTISCTSGILSVN